MVLLFDLVDRQRQTLDDTERWHSTEVLLRFRNGRIDNFDHCIEIAGGRLIDICLDNAVGLLLLFVLRQIIDRLLDGLHRTMCRLRIDHFVWLLVRLVAVANIVSHFFLHLLLLLLLLPIATIVVRRCGHIRPARLPTRSVRRRSRRRP